MYHMLAQVPGVDGVFIGPSDLAASMGHLGDVAHPDVQRSLYDAFAACLEAGTPVGCITSDVNTAHKMAGSGACFIALGTDISLLKTATKSMVASLR